MHKKFSMDGDFGIVSGLFYDDYSIDDYTLDDDATDWGLEKYRHQHSAYKYMVYAWNKNGSLNNDINRPTNKGTATAILKKKVISNLRYAVTKAQTPSEIKYFWGTPQLFSSSENTILKLGDHIYQGNVDTMLLPDRADGMYFGFNANRTIFNWFSCQEGNVDTPFDELSRSTLWWKTFSTDDEESKDSGFWYRDPLYNKWEIKRGEGLPNGDVGDGYVDLVMKKEPVRMKYKSSPHLVFELPASGASNLYSPSNIPNAIMKNNNAMPIIDIVRKNINTDTLFGGKSLDAFKEYMASMW